MKPSCQPIQDHLKIALTQRKVFEGYPGIFIFNLKSVASHTKGTFTCKGCLIIAWSKKA
jgi:hypothetical protein